MQPHGTSARNNTLAWITVGAAAIVGPFLLLGGLGLAFAVAMTRQGVAQLVTVALMLSGGVHPDDDPRDRKAGHTGRGDERSGDHLAHHLPCADEQRERVGRHPSTLFAAVVGFR